MIRRKWKSILVICTIIIIILKGISITPRLKCMSTTSHDIATIKWNPENDHGHTSTETVNIDVLNTEDVNNQHPDLQVAAEPKTIIFWTEFNGSPSWHIKAGKEECGQYTCFFIRQVTVQQCKCSHVSSHRTDWLLRLPTDRPRIPWQR